jgi:putative ABC transport system substrate-binding protein
MNEHTSRLSRRQVVLGAAGLGLVAGCGRLPWQGQPPAKMHQIRYLSAFAPSPNDEAFRDGLRDLGYVGGQNIAIEWRWANEQLDRLPEFAADLVRLPVDVVVTSGIVASGAAQTATSTIPIVMAFGGDPVGTGLITSLAHPGGNITGVTNITSQLSGKPLELLRDVLPTLHTVAVLWNPAESVSVPALEETEAAARALHVQVQSLEVRDADEFEGAFEIAMRARADALIALPAAFITNHASQITTLAARSRLPAVYYRPEFVEVGGLMAYAPSIPALFRRAAYYVDRILKGTKPADLPVEQPMTFEFVVNMKTAQALGIIFPNEILLQVTEVIQ